MPGRRPTALTPIAESKITMPWSDTVITSGRLALRPFSGADADEAFACITPTLTRYLSFEPAATPADFEAVWRGWLADIATGTHFNFTLRERAGGAFLGLLGLHNARTAEPELGLWIREDAHGRGYGREAVRALAEWASGHFAPRCLLPRGTSQYRQPPHRRGAGRHGDRSPAATQIRRRRLPHSRLCAAISASHKPVSLSRHQMMACNPLSAMTFSSLSAGPLGWVSPCSHLRTVEAEVCKCSANTG